MTSSFNSERVRSIARRAVPWLVGPAALVIRGPAGELASAGACPGLLELSSIAALRLNPELAVGPLLAVLHAAVIVGALAAFVVLVERRIRHIACAAATGLAVGLSPLFAGTLTLPTEAAAFGVCAAAGLLAASRFTDRRRPCSATFWLGAGLCLAGALTVPPWAAVAAAGVVAVTIVAWPLGGQRWVAALAAAGVLVTLVVGALNLSRPGLLTASPSWPALRACLTPRPSLAPSLAAAASILWWLGPFALGLAALGAVVAGERGRWRSGAAGGAAGLACLVLAASARLAAPVAIAPLAVLLWWCAGVGLERLVAAIGRGPMRYAAAALVLVLLPALETSRRLNEERDDGVPPRGHGTQTLHAMTSLLNRVSADAAFVDEDATVDLLQRAAVFAGHRKGKPFTVIPSDPAAVAQALAGGAVYAFPRRQFDLSLRGFVVAPLPAAGPGLDAIDGIAAVTATRPCRTVGAAWADVTGASGRIGFSTDAEEMRGPVTMYLGGASAGQPGPDAWPPRTIRGFRFFTFDQPSGAASVRLRAEARDVGLPSDHPVLAEPFVLRLTVHRTPRAPLALAVTLNAPLPIGAARVEPGGVGAGHLRICDAPVVAISALRKQ